MNRLAVSVLLLALLGVAACGDEPVTRLAGWEYRESGSLSYQSGPLSEDLAANRITLVTPAGTFCPQSAARWVQVAGLIPLPDPSRPWVHLTISSVPFTEEYRNQGYYRVDELPASTATWRDTQLDGTPPSWIYAFKGPVGSERGYWIDPQRLGEIDWSQL